MILPVRDPAFSASKYGVMAHIRVYIYTHRWNLKG